jgi:hypothetical protein
MTIAHQSGLLENRQMFRDGRLRDTGLGSHCPDGLFSSATKSFEDAPAGRIGKRPEERIVSVGHSVSITQWLYVNV